MNKRARNSFSLNRHYVNKIRRNNFHIHATIKVIYMVAKPPCSI